MQLSLLQAERCEPASLVMIRSRAQWQLDAGVALSSLPVSALALRHPAWRPATTLRMCLQAWYFGCLHPGG